MPHTNRKKKTSSPAVKKFAHSKREYIEYEDGWTQVADKGLKSILRKHKTVGGGAAHIVDMTLEEMVKEHDRYRKEWESSSAFTELTAILLNHEKLDSCAVTNTVCLGLGSLQGLSLEWRRSSHIQLAALLTITETLALTSQTLLQDPRFTELDKQFLTSKGYGVTEDPDAFSHIKESSLVYAIHCPLRLFSKLKQGPDPAVIIGNDFRDSRLSVVEMQEGELHEDNEKEKGEQKELLSDLTESSRNKPKHFQDTLELISNCEEIAFPQLRHDFTNTTIFWRYSPKADHSPF